MDYQDWLRFFGGSHSAGDYFLDLSRRAKERYPGSKWDQATPYTNPLAVSDDVANRYIFMARDFPIIGDWLKAADSYRAAEDYMRHRGMNWSDVEYPALWNPRGGTGIGRAAYSTVSFVSSNVSRLYH